jgi:hypothetical protein
MQGAVHQKDATTYLPKTKRECTACGDRTRDQSIKSRTLYLTELRRPVIVISAPQQAHCTSWGRISCVKFHDQLQSQSQSHNRTIAQSQSHNRNRTIVIAQSQSHNRNRTIVIAIAISVPSTTETQHNRTKPNTTETQHVERFLISQQVDLLGVWEWVQQVPGWRNRQRARLLTGRL